MNCIWNWMRGDSASNLGSFIGGISTFAALMFAWFQVKSWKGQQKELKRSEAAAEGIIGSEELKSTMRELAGIYLKYSSHPISAETNNIGSEFQKKYSWLLKTNAQNINSFHKSKIQAKIHLNDEINLLFNNVEADLDFIKVQLHHIVYCLAYDRDSLEEARDSIFGETNIAGREERILKLIEKLKIIARFEA